MRWPPLSGFLSRTHLSRYVLPPQGRLALVAILASIGWSLVLVLPHLRGEASVLDRIESALTDMRFAVTGPRPAPDDVVVVAIDDATVAAAGTYPVPRPYLAALLRALARAAPKAVAVDILFVDPGVSTQDEDLANALRSVPAVIGMAATFARSWPESRAAIPPFRDLPVADSILQPVAPLRKAARLGLVNVATDPGGTPRHIPLLIVQGQALQPSLALRSAALADGSEPVFTADSVSVGAVATPLDRGAGLALRFYGPQGSVRTVSAKTVMEGGAGESLRGRVLVVGATALASGDTLSTPFDPVLPGVELLATGIAHLMHGDPLIRTGAVHRVDAGIALALPILLILALSVRRVGIGLGLAALVLALFVSFAVTAFTQGIWLAMAMPLAAAAVPLAPYLGARLWLDRRREGSLTAARDGLLRFHPPAVAERLVHQPDFLDARVEQHAAVLFVDLSGFTGMSEALGPVRTRALLKEMHDLVEDIATLRGGSVTSFMGDGAMILFGLPEARDDDAHRCILTALALVDDLGGWLARLAAEIGAPTGIRVGAHAGVVVISRLGGARNQHITATGDTVNVASRLLDVAKTERVPVVLSADLVAGDGALPVGVPPPRHRRVTLRGRIEPLDVLCIPAQGVPT